MRLQALCRVKHCAVESTLTLSEDHLSWECSAYLLAMYSSFSGREILEVGNSWIFSDVSISKSMSDLSEQVKRLMHKLE